jgi:hypothetical protein
MAKQQERLKQQVVLYATELTADNGWGSGGM